MSEKIKHSGVVESVDGDCMKVRILQTSACAGCKAAGVCNAAEKKEKVIYIYRVGVKTKDENKYATQSGKIIVMK